MELPSSPSSTITAPPDYHNIAQRLGRLIVEAMTSSSALLHYDNASESMVEWCWPADSAGKKIPLSNFEKYHDEYEFRYPCCLCADGGGKGAYVEAAVYPWWNDTTKQTHWTARYDAKHHPVKIDIYFKLVSSVAFQYPRRDDKNPPIPPIQLEWTLREQTQLLDRLAVCDAIAMKEFRILFRCCKKCKRVAARPTQKPDIVTLPSWMMSASAQMIEFKRKAKVVSPRSPLHIEWMEPPASPTPAHKANFDELIQEAKSSIYIVMFSSRSCDILPENLGDKQGVFQTSELRLIDLWAIPDIEVHGEKNNYIFCRIDFKKESVLHQVNADDIQAAISDKLAVTLGIGLLDAYIGLIANHKLQTKVRVLSVLLKDRVYPGDLWEIVGECIIEAQQEAILRQHQNICTGMGDISFSSSAASTCAATSSPFSCPTAMRDKCEAWLTKPYTYPLPVVQPLVTEKCPFLDHSTLSPPEFSTTLEDKRASVIFNCVGPSLPLLSAWVPLDVQETFYDAFHVEQACQAGLMPQCLFVNGHHAYPIQRNVGLELLVLQAKMRHAKAEVVLYTMAIESACELNFPVSTSGYIVVSQ
ncbi:hypothetical protein EV702DRAFT_1050279 [Suillus placidus]|uniref:Uncharacterized protein n=1 Tax=Suillus placidus TaxID=48579 RepID=A0A9P7CXB5_9AGAM|nr:hypothetical protein EV702DRAFT_1050279 [Suillus placidus]